MKAPVILLGPRSLSRRIASQAPNARLREGRWTPTGATVAKLVVSCQVSSRDAERLRRDPLLRDLRRLDPGHQSDGLLRDFRGRDAGVLTSVTELQTIVNRASLKSLEPRKQNYEHSLVAIENETPLTRDGIFLTSDRLTEWLTTLSSAPIEWDSIRIHRGPTGVVFESRSVCEWALYATLPVDAVFLHRSRLADDFALWVDCDLFIPPGCTALKSPGHPLLATVREGRVRIEALDEQVSLDTFLHEQALVDLRPLQPDETARTDLKSDARTSEVTTWLRSSDSADRRLADELVEAFTEIKPGEDSSKPDAPEDEKRERQGWLRHFIRDRLPEGLRRRLRAWGRFKQSTPQKRDETKKRQTKAVRSLIGALAGPDWERAITAAFPLRKPKSAEGDAPWFNWAPEVRASTSDFSLDREAAHDTLGAVPLSKDLYERLQAIYAHIATRFEEDEDFRRAAHVYSYLLGDHARAARCLEKAGYHREAATLYYHLDDSPRNAAQALAQAKLFDEAARLWMDLGEWERAAENWSAAEDEEQELAAWRIVVAKHRDKKRFVEAAEILDARMNERAAALEILERCATSDHGSRLDAFTRAIEWHRNAQDQDAVQSLTADVERRVQADLLERPRRASFLHAFQWVDTMLRVGVVGADVPEIWSVTLDLWLNRREKVHRNQRLEIDAKCLASAEDLGCALGDPWLLRDVSSLLTEEPRTDSTLAEIRLPYREWHVPPLKAFLAVGQRILCGMAEGRISCFDETGAETGRWTMRQPHSVESLAVVGNDDLFASAKTEIAHFSMQAAELGAVDASPPLQVERNLAGQVLTLAALPYGNVLLRASTDAVHALHPAHLQSLGALHETKDESVAGLATGKGFAAVLLQCGRPSPTDPAHYEILVFRKRPRTGPGELQLVENVPLESLEPRRIALYRRDRDELIVVGREVIAFFPSRRSDVKAFEREITGAGDPLPTPFVAGLPNRDAMLVAYGDGTLEEISIETRERRFLLDAPPGPLDPLIGFDVREKPFRVLMAHRSGRVRILKHFRAED